MFLLLLRLTDLGSMTLQNIFGVQDAETLDNVLHKVINIVPRKETPSEGAPSGLSLVLKSVTEQSSHLKPIKEVDSTQVQVSVLNDRSSEDRASNGCRKPNKSGRQNSGRSKSDVRSKNMEGYVNPCLVSDSPTSPVATPLDLLAGGGESAEKSEDYTSKTKYSVFGRDAGGSSAENGAQVVAQNSSPERRRRASARAVDDRIETNLTSPAIIDLSLNQGTTLQTFLRNLAERSGDIANALQSSENADSSANLQALNLHHRVSFVTVYFTMKAFNVSYLEVLTYQISYFLLIYLTGL